MLHAIWLGEITIRHGLVHAHSPSRRDVVGQGRYADQQRRDTEKGRGVVGKVG
jgi:hypothetical protein